MNILIEVSLGELLDRLSILSIKLEKITDKNKLQNITHEYQILQKKFNNLLTENPDETHSLNEYLNKLRILNTEIWDIENTIRELEAQGSYGSDFIETARSIYFKNDERAAIKKEINTQYNSDLIEEKSYVD